jgi:hypothetical protein
MQLGRQFDLREEGHPPPRDYAPHVVEDDEWERATEQWVPVADLRSSQDSVSAERVDEIFQSSGGATTSPQVTRADGELLVHDGHHRVVAAHRRGQLFLEANVLDVEDW